MSVLLSIKPKYVKEIKKKKKLFEFRKQIFKQQTNEIWVYESAPTQKIVGKILIADIIENSPQDIWNSTKKVAGINKKDFFKYFAGKDKAYAIKIEDYCELETPINPYEIKKDFVPPQSFVYLDNYEDLQRELELA